MNNGHLFFFASITVRYESGKEWSRHGFVGRKLHRGKYTELDVCCVMKSFGWEKTGLSKSHPIFVLIMDTCPSICDHVGSGDCWCRVDGLLPAAVCCVFQTIFRESSRHECSYRWPLAKDTHRE